MSVRAQLGAICVDCLCECLPLAWPNRRVRMASKHAVSALLGCKACSLCSPGLGMYYAQSTNVAVVGTGGESHDGLAR